MNEEARAAMKARERKLQKEREETADAAATPTAIAPLVATIVQDVAITAETATASVLPRVPPAEVPPGAAGRSERVVPRRLGAFFLY